MDTVQRAPARNLIYQVFVDRFADSAGGQLQPVPQDQPAWHHHCGGTLDGVTHHLDHIQSLGVDAVYLTPIFHADSNHKYDTSDFEAVDARFGGDPAFERLAAACRERGMGFFLDGVFNHVGKHHHWFRAAQDEDSPEREYFRWTQDGGYDCWRGQKSLPELRLENKQLADALFDGPDSVLRRWLRRGATGWRMDCANDLGPPICARLVEAAEAEGAPDGIVGEVWTYADEWLTRGRLTGIMNYYFRETILALLHDEIPAAQASYNFKRMARHYPREALLRSWNMLSSHDTPRLAHHFPDFERRRFAWCLAFGYPGVPMLYYGEEFGMEGGRDPDNRRPMDWSRGPASDPMHGLLVRLAALRREQPALREGDYLTLPQPGIPALLAWARTTGEPSQTVLVLANTSDKPLEARAFIPYAPLHDAAPLRDLLGEAPVVRSAAGSLRIQLPPWGVAYYQADDTTIPGYRFFKRYAP